MCYSKTVLTKTQSTIHPRKTNFLEISAIAKQVLCFKKLISKEKKHQSITTPKESVNKQKIQIHVVIKQQ